MKLLILTQKADINDPFLGFFHGWVEEFARRCEQVTVICLFEGKHDFPPNVRVLTLGKEKIADYDSPWGKLAGKVKFLYRLFKFIWQERNRYDRVFVHMNQIYVVLGGLLWRAMGKRVGLWQAHKAVNISLRLAAVITNEIFTASAESFRVQSRKINIIGHGINTALFKPGSNQDKGAFRIITAGRISPVKDYETMIKALEILSEESAFKAEIVGGPGLKEHAAYLESLKTMVAGKKLDDLVAFTGPVPNNALRGKLNEADLFLHMSQTGSLDKGMLEAMACGLMVVSSNDSSKRILGDYGLVFKEGDAEDLAGKIRGIMAKSAAERKELGEKLRSIVVRDHGLENLINKIINILK